MNSLKVSPSQIIGAMGWLDEIGSEKEVSVSSVVKEATNSFFESIVDLGQEVSGTDVKPQAKERSNMPEQNTPGKGSIGGGEFQKSRTKADINAAMRIWTANLAQDLANIRSKDQMEKALSDRRAEVNAKIGIGNLSYVDTVSDNGSLRVDVETQLDQANSEISTEQVKANKENTLAAATGATALQTAFEGASGSQGGGTANLSANAAG